MSSKSKRTLYKPAPINVVPKRNRKPLAQGRLITETNHEANKKTPSLKVQEVTTEDGVLPRKGVPSQDNLESQRPYSTLDLSDLDVEVDDASTNQSVIVMEASENLLNPDQCEVNVTTSIQKSPVRVVCHVTDVLSERSLNNMVHEPNDVNTLKQQSTTIHAISPSLKERPKSATKQRSTPIRKTVLTPKKSGSYPQPNFNDSNENLSRKVPEDDDDIQSVTSDTDICSIDEYIPVIKSRTTDQKSSSKSSTIRHKTASSIIPSRYMQASNKTLSTSQRNTSLKSVNKSTSANKSRSSSQNRSATAKLGPQTTTTKKPHTPVGVNSSTTRPVTPNVPASQTGGGKTSTPYSTETLSMHTQDIDASAIQAEISAISLMSADLSVIRKAGSSSATKKNKPKKYDQKASQQRLEIYWSRYLQWLYLDSKAKQVSKEREKMAMSQTNSLWQEVEQLREKEASISLDLVRLKHMNQLDDQIEIQRNGLEPVISNLPVLERDYEKLSESLDTTRHQISTKGIHIPDDEDRYQVDLQNVLKESEYLLGEISCIVRSEIPKTGQFSKSLQSANKLVDTERSELRTCTELMSAIKSLTVQESSLQIQSIQSKEE